MMDFSDLKCAVRKTQMSEHRMFFIVKDTE